MTQQHHEPKVDAFDEGVRTALMDALMALNGGESGGESGGLALCRGLYVHTPKTRDKRLSNPTVGEILDAVMPVLNEAMQVWMRHRSAQIQRVHAEGGTEWAIRTPDGDMFLVIDKEAAEWAAGAPSSATKGWSVMSRPVPGFEPAEVEARALP